MLHPDLLHPDLLFYMGEWLFVLPLVVPLVVPGRLPGRVSSTPVSGTLVSGTGMVMVSVGMLFPRVLGVVPVDGVTAGLVLVQPQAHKESAKTSAMTKIASFFMKILLY